MKSYLAYISKILLLTFLLFSIITFSILLFPSNVFHSSYQSVIQDKYQTLLDTNDPKIVLVGGSNLAFGLNQEMLEEATGYKVVNLGLHAGFGHLFYSELSKANINEGDIVLLAYEYDWVNGFTKINQRLVMSAIGNRLDMYLHIPISQWPKLIGYLFKFGQLKNTYEPETGVYSREAFDPQTAQMIAPREIILEYSEDSIGYLDLDSLSIRESTKKYLTTYKELIEKKGAQVFFVSPPIVKDGIKGDCENLEKLKADEIAEIGIPYISEPMDYLFPCEYMYDSLYHCNTTGEQYRTRLLIQDLQNANIIP